MQDYCNLLSFYESTGTSTFEEAKRYLAQRVNLIYDERKLKFQRGKYDELKISQFNESMDMLDVKRVHEQTWGNAEFMTFVIPLVDGYEQKELVLKIGKIC